MGHHVHNADPGFRGDGAENIVTARSTGGDLGSRAPEIAGIEHINRNVLMNGRKQGRRVQDFCAKIRQLGGFVEADALDSSGLGTESRVSSHHAFDIGPDFNAIGVERRADDGGRIVRSAATKSCWNAVGGCRNESAHDRNAFF